MCIVENQRNHECVLFKTKETMNVYCLKTKKTMNVYCLKPKKPLMFIVEKEPKKTVPILVL